MAPYRLRALVLKYTKLGETDSIVTMLAEDGHQVRAVAKGARKPGSRTGGRLQPFAVVDLLLHTGRSLDVVSEVEVVESREALRTDLDRATAASVVADLLDKATLEGDVQDRLYALALATLDAMETADAATLLALVVAFVAKALAMLGFRPLLSACATCGGEPGDSEAFSNEAGGVLCEACSQQVEAVTRISVPARAALATLLQARMQEIGAMEFPGQALRECVGVLRAYAVWHVPARLRSLEYLERHPIEAFDRGGGVG